MQDLGNCTYTAIVSGKCASVLKNRGVDPYGTGQGGHVPQYLDWGDIITNVPLNISRVISATFYPCNIFLIS